MIPKKDAMQIARSAAVFLAYQLIYGLSDKTTDLSAHVGGLVAGFVVGCLLLGQTAGDRGREECPRYRSLR